MDSLQWKAYSDPKADTPLIFLPGKGRQNNADLLSAKFSLLSEM
jgi:hypothetical protein